MRCVAGHAPPGFRSAGALSFAAVHCTVKGGGTCLGARGARRKTPENAWHSVQSPLSRFPFSSLEYFLFLGWLYFGQLHVCIRFAYSFSFAVHQKHQPTLVFIGAWRVARSGAGPLDGRRRAVVTPRACAVAVGRQVLVVELACAQPGEGPPANYSWDVRKISAEGY